MEALKKLQEFLFRCISFLWIITSEWTLFSMGEDTLGLADEG